jgi:hypothetical protein
MSPAVQNQASGAFEDVEHLVASLIAQLRRFAREKLEDSQRDRLGADPSMNVAPDADAVVQLRLALLQAGYETPTFEHHRHEDPEPDNRYRQDYGSPREDESGG